MRFIKYSWLLSLVFTVAVKAQEATTVLPEGTVLFSLGYGKPNLAKTLFKFDEKQILGITRSFDQVSYSGFSPVSFKAEYIIADRVGLGLSYNYVNFKRQASLNSAVLANGKNGVGYVNIYFSSWSILARLNMHLIVTKSTDFYWGIGLGYREQKFWEYSNLPTFNGAHLNYLFFPVSFESGFGLRYFITPHFAVYSEIGIAKALLQGGLVYKL